MTGFAYRAGAAALGGYLTRPFTEPLQVQAASFLTPVGGYGSARVEHYRFHEIVSFRAGYTQVIGIEHEANGRVVRETLAQAVVEGLDILGMVTADRVVARLASSSPGEAGEEDELRILPVGSYFENLRIAGHLLEPRMHPHLLDEKAATRSRIEAVSKGLLFDPDAPEGGKPIEFPRRGKLRCSLCLPLRQAFPGATAGPGGRIVIPGFGDIYLGEFIVSSDHRQLTMIRVELHSPEKGRVACAAVEGNGSPY
jgi:hypothetical protein